MTVLGALTALSALWLLIAARAQVAAVGRAIRRQTASSFTPGPRPAPEGVSVIITAGDDARALESLLKRLFVQEYDGKMEVIVVNDGKNDEVKDAVTRIKHLERRPNLHTTFTPSELRNVSHRKLALALGIKKASYPVVIALTEQSQIRTPQWLARMAAPFGDPEVSVAVASALPSVKADKGMGKRYRSFTHGADAAEWLWSALQGKPWRAHRCNMAFRRDAFEAAGAFTGALNLRDGDDDLLISKMARTGRCVAVLAQQAGVTYKYPDSRYEFSTARPARFYSRRGLRRCGSTRFALNSLAAWTLTLAGAGACAAAALLGNWPVLGAVAALMLASVITLSLTWRSTLGALRCRRSGWGTWPRLLRRPFTNMRHRMLMRARQKEYHTWPT